MHVCVCVRVCHMYVEEDFGSLGTGFADYYDLTWVLGTKFGPCRRARSALTHYLISPAPPSPLSSLDFVFF